MSSFLLHGFGCISVMYLFKMYIINFSFSP